jgi:Z1 domain
MGRWFGFRRGYSDLVRLFIGRQEPLGKGGGTIDLYAAFEGACRDELALRDEFKKYASAREGGSGLRPIDVPPLVASHMLRPTSANKMYDVEIQFQNFGEDYLERTLAPDDDTRMRANEGAMRDLLRQATPKLMTLDGEHDGVDVGYEALVCIVDSHLMREFLSTYRWQDDRPILARVVDYLNRPPQDTRVYRWILIAPQDTKSPAQPWVAGPIRFAARHRSRTEPGGRYGVYSESKHRYIAKALAGVEPDTILGPTSAPLALSPGQAVMLFYPVRDEREPASFTTMGFALQFPKSRMPVQIRFGVRSAAVATPGQGIA